MRNLSLKAVLYFVCGCLLATGGCGTGAYNEAFTNRLATLKRQAPFTVLTAPVTLTDTSVQICIPKAFTNQLNEGQADPQGGKIDPRRVQPPFLKLPGFKFAYEAQHDNAGEITPYYCYLAALPTQDAKSATLASDLEIELKSAFPDWGGVWEETEVDSPSGGKVKWKMLEVKGLQFFDVDNPAQNKQEFKKVPGVFQLWLHENEHYQVLVGWRVTEAANQTLLLEKLARRSAGTLMIGPPPAPPQPPAEESATLGNPGP